MNIEIRYSKLQDLEDLSHSMKEAFIDASFRYKGHKNNVPDGSTDGSVIAKHLPLGYTFSAVITDKLIGGAIIVPRESGKGSIHSIWVLPEFQGRGIGKAIMNFLELEFPSITYWSLETPKYAIDNQRFYESLGYRKVNEFLLNGTDVTLLEYVKSYDD